MLDELNVMDGGSPGIDLEGFAASVVEEMVTGGEPPELKNLADGLEEDELRQIAEQAIREFEMDDASRREWLDMHAHWVELFNQRDKPVNPPWEGASEESIPILAEAVVQFHARAFRAMFPNDNIVKAVPTGKVTDANMERAKRVGQHMSWQLMTKDRRYKRDKDALLLSVAIHGSMFTKTYYDPVVQRNITRNVRAEDLVVNYGVGPRAIEDVERKTEIIWMTVNETRIRKAMGYFSEEGQPWDASRGETELQQQEQDAEGISKPADTGERYMPCCILEQHTVLDLDEDGIAEPYIVWVDRASRKVLRLQIRYEVDPMGNPTYDKAPIEYFDHYTFIPNPDGFYALGMGFLLGHINTAVNKILRQTVDAATLANVGNQSGFMSSAIGADRGDVQMQLGKLMRTTVSGDELQKGIFTFKFPGPQPALVQIMQMLQQAGRGLASSPEAFTGNTEKVLQPTTFLGLVEQAQVFFSTVYERLFGTWQNELLKHYRLNGKYLEMPEYFAVNDLSGTPEEVMVSRMDYQPDLMVVPMADPKMATEQQRLAQSEAEYTTALQNPLVAQNPESMLAVSRRRFEAIGSRNVDEFVKLPPPQEPPPDPKMVAIEVDARLREMEMNLKAQMEQQRLAFEEFKAMLDAGLRRQEMARTVQ